MKKNNITFIIQARLGSTRLPNKIVIPFYNGFSIFDILIEKLKNNFNNLQIILATSTNSENDLLEEIATKNDILVFRGDENDVLKRFIDSAEHYNADRIIRICSDNPFLDVKELCHLVSFVEENDYDYVSFDIEGTPSIKTHFGFWAEFVTLKALKEINKTTSLALYHEHVTNYIYEHPDKFNICFLKPNKSVIGRSDIRMTLDTEEDFNILTNIYTALSKKYSQLGIDEIINFLDENSDYKNLMAEQIKINKK